MKADRWRLVEKIFNGALELEGHEQSSFLDRECASDHLRESRPLPFQFSKTVSGGEGLSTSLAMRNF